jgi:hypothetical protein
MRLHYVYAYREISRAQESPQPPKGPQNPVTQEKETAMKRIPAITLVAVAALVTAFSAGAQDHGVKAAVPFNFTVNGSSVPAGSYMISSTSANLFSLKNKQENVNIWAVGLTGAKEPGQAGSLLFHKYGDRYFLSEIRYPHSSTMVHLPTSRIEKKVREHTLEASLNVNNNVLIALN